MTIVDLYGSSSEPRSVRTRQVVDLSTLHVIVNKLLVDPDERPLNDQVLAIVLLPPVSELGVRFLPGETRARDF